MIYIYYIMSENTGMESLKMGGNAQQMQRTQKQKKEEFERIVGHYLESNPMIGLNREISELEIRFGTNPQIAKPINKMNYDNVVKQLYACGFKPENSRGIQILRI